MDRSRIAVVIPAWNEATTIAGVVMRIAPLATPIVVDDGSHDETCQLALAAGAKVVQHPKNRGYDQALNTGFAHAAELGCEYIVTMDADGQHDPATLHSFVDALKAGADVVIGIRPARQRLAEVLFAWVARWKWGINDPLCGMKGYRLDIYRALGHFDSYGSIGTELAIFAARLGVRVVQLPLPIRERADAPRFGRRWKANLRILRALWLGIVGRNGECLKYWGAARRGQNSRFTALR